jgi:uncharacterized protein
MNDASKHSSISLKTTVAKTFVQRAVGLLGRSKLNLGEAMFFPNSRSIHTFGMLFAIDVVYLNERLEIVEIDHWVQPFRISWCRQADSLCEISGGAAIELGLQKGQRWSDCLHF